MERIYDVIKRPLVTEKNSYISEKQNTYVFEVAKDANKKEIKDAVEKIFNVKVKSINTMINHGKEKRVGRYKAKISNWKKALVTLNEGQKIEIFEGV